MRAFSFVDSIWRTWVMGWVMLVLTGLFSNFFQRYNFIFWFLTSDEASLLLNVLASSTVRLVFEIKRLFQSRLHVYLGERRKQHYGLI